MKVGSLRGRKRGEEVRRELGERQHQERNGPHAAIGEAQLDVIVRTELEVGDGLRIGVNGLADDFEEAMEAVRGGVVGAGRPDHVQAFQTQLGLERAQRVDLAWDPDHGQPPVAARAGGL